MTHQTLIETLYKLDLTNAKVLIPQKAVYVARPSEDGHMDEFIVLFNNGIRVGGIYIMGDVDIHAIIFEEFRNNHYLSDFMRSGYLKKIRPNLKYTTTDYSPIFDEEYKVVHHLATLAGLILESQ